MSSTDLFGFEINPILRKIQDNNAENHNKIKFLVEIGDGDFDEIISYNTLYDLVEDQNEDIIQEEKTWIFKSIQGHQGPPRKMILTIKGHLTMS
jgi:hypothetical protein